MNTITLRKGNCLELMKTIPDNSVDLVLTDPPYNLANFMDVRSTNLAAMRPNFFGSAGWDEFTASEWEEAMDIFFKELHRVLKPRGAAIIFMSLMRMETLIRLSEKNMFYYKTIGAWHKTNPMPRNMKLQFVNSIEGWLYLINLENKSTKKSTVFNNGGKCIHDFIESSLTPGSECKHGRHPTQKPVSVFRHFVELLTNPGDTVLDPFMGAGTAPVVASITGRNAIGIELVDKYFDMARLNVEDVISKDCKLIIEE